MARFLLTTFGSFGDLHPYIAVGLGLRARGHAVTIATSEIYRTKVEGEDLRFHPVQPDMRIALEDPDVMRRVLHPRKGSEYVFRDLMMPHVEASYEETLAAARDADVLVSHALAFATSTVAEVLGKPWMSIALQPAVFLSKFDPPVISGADVLHPFQNAGPWFWGPVLGLARRMAGRWGTPLNALRLKLGLQELENPVFGGMFSAHGTQAWFSPIFAAPQKDWPPRTEMTGFPFYDKLEPGAGMSPELERFLAAGPPPVVFTLGSSANLGAGSFYAESVKAAHEVGCRAVLLTGRDPQNLSKEALPDTIFETEYAPYSGLLDRAAATVHSGGIGTTAQALRAGRPMIVVPWSHDQPDNARRVAGLGAGVVVRRREYRAARIARELRKVLNDSRYAEAAVWAQAALARENGVSAACGGLERLATSGHPGPLATGPRY